MNYAVEMDLGALIDIPNFIKTGSAIQKLIGGYTWTQAHIQQGDLISPFFFKIRKVA
jgi:hypothetical protein